MLNPFSPCVLLSKPSTSHSAIKTKKVIKTKAVHNSWIPIHSSSSALRAGRKALRLIKYVGSSVMSTQTRLALPVSACHYKGELSES